MLIINPMASIYRSSKLINFTTHNSCDTTRLKLHRGNLWSRDDFDYGNYRVRMSSRWELASLKVHCCRNLVLGVAMDLIHGSTMNGSFKRAHQEQVFDDDDDDDDDDGAMLMGSFTMGKLIDSGLVFWQNFIIRYYEIGPDKTVTVETLMNLLQEAGTNHAKIIGLIHEDELVANKIMKLVDLVWVVCRVHVQFSRYSSWGNVVQVDAWSDMGGRNAMRRDWIIRDHNTKQTIAKATSMWMMVNKETKRLSKMPERFKEAMEPFWNHRCAFKNGEDDTEKINKLTDETANLFHSNITPKWNDMDANQHVNYIKYIGWVMEVVPTDILVYYNLKNITLEYRKECRHGDVLESLSSIKQPTSHTPDLARAATIKTTHLLRKQEDKVEVLRARILWQSKS